MREEQVKEKLAEAIKILDKAMKFAWESGYEVQLGIEPGDRDHLPQLKIQLKG